MEDLTKEDVLGVIEDVNYEIPRSNSVNLRRWVLPVADRIALELTPPQIHEDTKSLESRAKSKSHIMALDSEHETFIGIILLMKGEFGSWFSGKVYDYISNRLMSIIKEKLTDKKYPGTIKFSASYKNGTTVTLEVPNESQQAIDSLPVLFGYIQQDAFIQSQINRPKGVYVYRMKDGKLLQNE